LLQRFGNTNTNNARSYNHDIVLFIHRLSLYNHRVKEHTCGLTCFMAID
jgi:hypothetical protein